MGKRAALHRGAADDYRRAHRAGRQGVRPQAVEEGRLSAPLHARLPARGVEAKVLYKTAEQAVQQARQYAEMLGLKFAFATNGHEIIECDYFAGTEVKRPDFPTPAELWERYRSGNNIRKNDVADGLLSPSNHEVGKGERYYQQIAINRAIEAILQGDHRLLLTMATGTGKTAVAFQICWKLWNARWNRTGDYRRPRILYLADRNILIDQPKDGNLRGVRRRAVQD